MSTQIQQEYDALRNEFTKVTKRILQKRELSSNPDTRANYEHDLIENYNNYIDFVRKNFNTLIPSSRETVREHVRLYRGKIIECFERLEVECPISDKFFGRIKINDLDDSGDEDIPSLEEASEL